MNILGSRYDTDLRFAPACKNGYTNTRLGTQEIEGLVVAVEAVAEGSTKRLLSPVYSPHVVSMVVLG